MPHFLQVLVFSSHPKLTNLTRCQIFTNLSILGCSLELELLKILQFPKFLYLKCVLFLFFLYCKYWIFKQNHTFKLITIQFLKNTAMKYQLTSLILWCECLLEAVSWEFPIHKENVKVKMSEIRTLFLMETLFYFKMTTKVLTNELFSWPFVTIDTRKLLHFTDFEDTGLH